MKSYRLVLEYDGSRFEGWQLQPGEHRTVQGVLGSALERLASGSARITGAGRTDSGVHAEGQVACVRVDTRLTPDELQRALNGLLPSDVAVLSAEAAPAGFDARRDAISKLYRYRIWNGARRSPLRAARALEVRGRLDLPAMRTAASALVGEHDFASFQAAGSDVGCSVRRLSRCEILGQAGGDLEIECEGSGFLRHMVRNIAGTLIEVAQGRRAADSIGALLAARSRSLAGPTAAAHGLTLVRVDYAPAEPPVSA